MSGHSHWAGIKHKKEAADQKRGKIFSKLLAAISAAAKTETNPDFNPRLRTAVEKAKEASVPGETIERAIKRAGEIGQSHEELIFEAYGPGGVAILIEAISDNKNRAVQEIKIILGGSGGKWAESGSVLWAFEKTPSGLDAKAGVNWLAKFPQELGEEDKNKLTALVAALEENENVQKIYTNISIPS